MTEIHIRKVRETETGGTPSPLDEPFKMIMNTSHTGFIAWGKQRSMISPQVFLNGEQEELDFSKKKPAITPNSDFLPILQGDEKNKIGDKAKEEA